jgi:ribosomal protein S19
MSRSSWKGLYINKINNNIKSKIWERNTIISQNFIDLEFLVYNGKEFKKVYINRPKLGFKLGEFSLTRKIREKVEDKKRKKKK